jgi:APA family basic amino acid/polyamine antiporter
VALVVSHTIAVGIFLTPAELIGGLAWPAMTLALWVGGGAMVLAGATTFGELASRYPQAGGLYVYLREAWGSRVACLYAWQSLLVLDPGVTAALASGASQYAVLIWPAASGQSRVIATALVWALALLSMSGLRMGARVFGALTLIKLATLAAIIITAFAGDAGTWSHFDATGLQSSMGRSFGEAMAIGVISVFFSFGGFWEASRIAAEVQDPRRTVPRALVIGVTAVTAIYIATTAAFIYLVSPAEATSATAFARLVGEAAFGPAGAMILAWAVVLSVVPSAMAMLMVAPRLYEAMARDGLFPAAIAARRAGSGAPVRATVVLAALATLLVWLGTFDQIVAFFVATALVFIALAAAAIFVCRRREHDRAPYRAWGYPVTPALFIVLVVGVLILIAANRPFEAAAGTGAVALGALVDRLVFRPGAR